MLGARNRRGEDAGRTGVGRGLKHEMCVAGTSSPSVASARERDIPERSEGDGGDDVPVVYAT